MNPSESWIAITQEDIDMSARLLEKAALLKEVDPKVARECFLEAYNEVFIPSYIENQKRRREIERSPEFQLFMGTPIAL